MPSVLAFPAAVLAAVRTLDTSLDPHVQLAKLRAYRPSWPAIATYVFLCLLALLSLFVMASPGFPLKLGIPILYTTALLIPATAQFFEPTTPIFAWLLWFYSSKFVPNDYRPPIHVALLPTLETVLYGANVSDILTRFTHPVLDILAWLPYGVIHFTAPFVVALCLWVLAPKGTIRFFGTAFGYMNLAGVLVQCLLPCAAPWYELIYGLTPATYAIHGHPGGLARIDAIFHNTAYTATFSISPVVFGAFPSLHAGCATMEVLFLSHFFPRLRILWWGYAFVLYWSTMYLTHHYLIDVVVGACMSVTFFYLFLPAELREPGEGPKYAAVNGYSPMRYDVESAAPPTSFATRPSTWTDRPVSPTLARSPSPEAYDLSLPSPPSRSGEITPGSAPLSARRGGSMSLPSGRAHRQTASIASLSGVNRPLGEGDVVIGPPSARGR